MEIGDTVSVGAFVAAVDAAEPVMLSAAARGRIAAARAVVDRYAAGSEPIYGLNTGLGANLGHRIAPGEMQSFQAQLLRGRAVAVGAPLDARICRAALLARLIGAARGASGLSIPVVEMMCAMLDRGLAPAIPRFGSIGAGDLTQAAHFGLAFLGEGEIWAKGKVVPAAAALRGAGLAPVVLAPKDALALANHSAVTVARAAIAADAAERRLTLAMATAALAGEGYAVNLSIFAPEIQALRPASGQVAAAAWFRAAFAGSSLAAGQGPRAIQDALSFRVMATVFGAARVALGRLMAALETELNAGADNPAVIGTDAQAVMRSTPNFQTQDIALALDAVAIAMVHVAAGAAQRVVKMMAPALSGLPRYLSPEGGASAGFVPIQKTVAALLAEIQRHGVSVPGLAMVVSEMVEDVAPLTPQCAQRICDQLEAFRWLTGIEAMVAAQAVDLRAPAALGRAGAILHPAIRSVVPMLGADRPTGRDVAPILAAIEAPGVMDALAAI